MAREELSVSQIRDYSNYNYQDYERPTKPGSGKKKRKPKIALWKKLVFLVFVFILFIICQKIQEQNIKIEEGLEQIRELEVHVDKLERENERLKFKESRMYDEDYIAEIARQKFHLSKPGEILFITPKN